MLGHKSMQHRVYIVYLAKRPDNARWITACENIHFNTEVSNSGYWFMGISNPENNNLCAIVYDTVGIHVHGFCKIRTNNHHNNDNVVYIMLPKHVLYDINLTIHVFIRM